MKEGDHFQRAYRGLEERMQVLADADGSVFLPSPEPQNTVQYIFVCMEPSLGRWARSAKEARSRVKAGHRNFLASIDDSILHFCAHNYLCKPGEHYHITDISKGAMLVKGASSSRIERYDRWYPLLQEEIDLLASPDAGIIAVGKVSFNYLQGKSLGRDLTHIIHYSPLAASAREEGARGREHEFEAFQKTVSREDLIARMESVLNSARVSDVMRAYTLLRLQGSELTTSRKKLMFTYKLAFESYAARRERG